MATGDGTPRTYDLTDPGDVPAGDVNSDQLTTEIEDEPLLAGATLDSITINDDLMDILFTAPLDAGEILALDAVVANHVPQELTDKYQFAESNPAQTTTSDTYVEMHRLDSALLVKGDYIVSWSVELDIIPTGPVNTIAQARVQIDGVVKGVFSHNFDRRNQFAGWDRIKVRNAKAPEVVIEVRAQGGNDTVEARRFKIAIEAATDENA